MLSMAVFVPVIHAIVVLTRDNSGRNLTLSLSNDCAANRSDEAPISSIIENLLFNIITSDYFLSDACER
jgi:hypothetical protein